MRLAWLCRALDASRRRGGEAARSRPAVQLRRASSHYRSKLYDELEALHPAAFDNSDDDACRRGTALVRRFLKTRLTKDGVKLNSDGFEMLWHDFNFSGHFYERAESYKRLQQSGVERGVRPVGAMRSCLSLLGRACGGWRRGEGSPPVTGPAGLDSGRKVDGVS